MYLQSRISNTLLLPLLSLFILFSHKRVKLLQFLQTAQRETEEALIQPSETRELT
jgi:hypothetical protein